MPACARCGKQFSGFSFGSTVPTECRECRRAFPRTVAHGPSDAPVTVAGDELLLLGGDPPLVTRAIIANPEWTMVEVADINLYSHWHRPHSAQYVVSLEPWPGAGAADGLESFSAHLHRFWPCG